VAYVDILLPSNLNIRNAILFFEYLNLASPDHHIVDSVKSPHLISTWLIVSESEDNRIWGLPVLRMFLKPSMLYLMYFPPSYL